MESPRALRTAPVHGRFRVEDDRNICRTTRLRADQNLDDQSHRRANKGGYGGLALCQARFCDVGRSVRRTGEGVTTALAEKRLDGDSAKGRGISGEIVGERGAGQGLALAPPLLAQITMVEASRFELDQ